MTLLQEKIQQEAESYRQVRLAKEQAAYYLLPFLQEEHFYWPRKSYPLEKNRYSLIWLPACPRAQRVATTIDLLGLTDWIEKIELDPHRDRDWHFRRKTEGAYYLYELFENKKDAVQPCLYDKKYQEVITNDQYNLSTLLVQFGNELGESKGWDLYPTNKQLQIDAMNGFIFKEINVQIYRAGHADKMEDKIQEEAKLKQTLQLLDDHLTHFRFLLGETLTDADLRLFPSLLRCPIYVKQFGLHSCQLTAYKNLWRYVQEIYQISEVQQNTKLEAIVETHYRSPHNLKKFGSQYQDETVASTFEELDLK